MLVSGIQEVIQLYMNICVHDQSCPTLCDSMDCSPPGSSVHGILQARTLEWVAISYPRGSSQPRDWTRVSFVPYRQILYHWATWEARMYIYSFHILFHYDLLQDIEYFPVL